MRLSLCSSHAVNRTADPLISSTTTDVTRHCGIDIRVRRLRIPGKQRRRRHDLSRLAIAALGHLFGNPCSLQRVIRCGRKPLDGGHFLSSDIRYGNAAGTHRRSIDVDRAGTALLQPASEFRSSQTDRVANDPQQGCVRTDIDVVLFAIDRQGNHGNLLSNSKIYRIRLELPNAVNE